MTVLETMVNSFTAFCMQQDPRNQYPQIWQTIALYRKVFLSDKLSAGQVDRLVGMLEASMNARLKGYKDHEILLHELLTYYSSYKSVVREMKGSLLFSGERSDEDVEVYQLILGALSELVETRYIYTPERAMDIHWIDKIVAYWFDVLQKTVRPGLVQDAQRMLDEQLHKITQLMANRFHQYRCERRDFYDGLAKKE